MERAGSAGKELAMNNKTTSIANVSIQLHCQHRFPSHLPIADTGSSLCSKHAALHQQDLDQADLAASLIGDTEEFRSAVVINRSLGELYKLQARNKIHPRRAAVMAYTANLLLRTLPAIERELHPEDEIIQVDFGDLPRPARTPNPSQDYPRQT
jgi:hypothetical protein